MAPPTHIVEVYVMNLPRAIAGILMSTNGVLQLFRNDALTDEETRGLWWMLLHTGKMFTTRLIVLKREELAPVPGPELTPV